MGWAAMHGDRVYGDLWLGLAASRVRARCVRHVAALVYLTHGLANVERR